MTAPNLSLALIERFMDRAIRYSKMALINLFLIPIESHRAHQERLRQYSQGR